MLKRKTEDNRLTVVAGACMLIMIWIVIRLFMLQVLEHDYYSLFALSSHEISRKIHPNRGTIYFQDTRTRERFPAALNREYYLVYAVPKDISSYDVQSTTARLADILSITDPEKIAIIQQKLSRANDVYEPLARKISSEQIDKIKQAGLKGVYASAEVYRFYPEETMASNVLGFCSLDDSGNLVGKYGIEGYWNKRIAGRGGFLSGERGALGNWIAMSDRTFVDAEDGPSIVLTIDRTLEYKACERLRQGMEEYKAKSGALVLMNPTTGAVLAMCSLPDFDPNNYSKTADMSAFNNTTVFTPYEPGSVFKSITMAGGLDMGLVSPNTTFVDPCKRVINGHTIRNAQDKCYGLQTMTNVLEKSINTGVVWVQEKMGNPKLKEYTEKFGFGERTGIEVNTESAGDISSLSKPGQIFGANGSFGQGLTVTPIQLAAAYSAIANGGKLPKSHIVQEVDYPNGKVEKIEPEFIEQAISERASKLLQGMLVSVVENHYHAARIPGYYVAGKTGTAQIPEHGTYSADRTNHTFAGFAPADNPEFVLIVKYEEPQRQWAEQTALPVFKDVMQYALEYYGIQPTR